MISLNCPLTDKDKVKTILTAKCTFQGIRPNYHTYCRDCSYAIPSILREMEEAIQASLSPFHQITNDVVTKQEIVEDLSDCLKEFSAKQQINDFKVVCNETNNINPAQTNIEVYFKLVKPAQIMKIDIIIPNE